MSAQMRDWSTVEHEQADAEHHDAVPPSTHPRGAGFRVLSRLARTRAEESPEYSPRHRQDDDPEDLPTFG